MSALDLIDAAIADLEAKLNLAPGASLRDNHKQLLKSTDERKSDKKQLSDLPLEMSTVETSPQQPDICKLEFKVGTITKVWVHPEADKLYCEEIDVGEIEPRLIASGLRKYYSVEDMMGRKVVIVSNLKVRS
jgi:tRNA-binding EMAP/Myf-like protein